MAFIRIIIVLQKHIQRSECCSRVVEPKSLLFALPTARDYFRHPAFQSYIPRMQLPQDSFLHITYHVRLSKSFERSDRLTLLPRSRAFLLPTI